MVRIKILDFDFEGVLDRMLERICQTLNAEAGTLFLIDHEKKEMVFKVVYGEKAFELIGQRFSWDRGICGFVARTGQGIIVDEPEKDTRFNPEIDAKVGFKTRSLLCLPLSTGKKTIGVIEIVNKRGGSFNRSDFELMLAVTAQATITLENYLYYQEMLVLSNYNRQLLESLSGGLITIDEQGTVTNFNPRASTLLGLLHDEVIGKSYTQALEKYPQIVDLFSEILKTHKMQTRKEMVINDIHGKTLRLGYSTILVEDKDGKNLGCALLFQDLTRL